MIKNRSSQAATATLMLHQICALRTFVFFLCSLLFIGTLLATDSNDPAEEFLLAYQNYQQGERLERAGKRDEAIAKYHFAEDVLTDLTSKNPDWQQQVVDYRLHKVRDSLARINGSSSSSENASEGQSESATAEPVPAKESTPVAATAVDTPSISITPPAEKESISDREMVQLQKQLKKTELELQKARGDIADKTTELDQSKVTIVDMKSQLEKAERQVTDLKSDLSKVRLGSSQREAALQQSVHTLEGKVDALAADQEVVLEENKELQQHLKQASDSLVAGLGAKQHLEQLQVEMNAGKNSAALLHEKLIVAQNERDATSEKNKALQKQIQDAATSLVSAKKQAQELDLLRSQNEKLRGEDAEKNKLLAQKEEQSKSADYAQKKLRDELQKKLTAAEGDQEVLQEEIVQYKSQLQQGALKLVEEEKKIATLEKAEPEREHLLQAKEKELADARLDSEKLQKDLLSANQKLATLQTEVHLKDDRYNELKSQLDQKNEELVTLKKKGESHPAEEKAIAENELLKGIVIRELKAEAKRQQTKKLITEDLEKLKINSTTLSQELKKLAKPTKLTPEERALFKDTPLPSEATSQEEADDTMMLSASAPKKEDRATNVISETNALAVTNTPAAAAVPTANTNNVKNALSSTNAPVETGKNKTNDSYRQIVAKAKEQFEHQNYLEAEKSFQDAVAIVPDDYLTLSNLGVVEFQLGKMSEAETILKKAIALDHKKSFALTTLGIVHYRQERMDEADKILRQAIAVNDQDFTAHNYLGIVLAASGKGKAGESEIMRSLEINPQYADAHFNLAVIYATGKPPAKEMARSHYTKATSLGAPPDPALEKLLN